MLSFFCLSISSVQCFALLNSNKNFFHIYILHIFAQIILLDNEIEK